jgi:alpha-L-fucosidase
MHKVIYVARSGHIDLSTWVALAALTIVLPYAPAGSASAAEARMEKAMKTIDDGVAAGPFKPAWESLESQKVPQWYLDGKFGIFIHWGVYCVPAFGNEWYPRNMYIKGSNEFKHHVATYGPQSKFGYKDFIPLFKAEKFNADEWAGLFRKAGAKFVVPVAEHHDGFPMYDCGLSDWCAARMGPKRDIVGELAPAVQKQGMVFGLSSHRAEHWWFFNGGTAFDSDVKDPNYAGLYAPAQSDKRQPNQAFLDDWLARICELVDKYQPQLVWFDWWIEQPVFKPYLQKFGAFYYNRGAQWNKGVAINYKNEAFPARAAVWDIERGQLGGIRPVFWQTDTSISKNSWGYVKKQYYKTADSIIGDLVDIVSKNGALLLNIGPKPDGTIPEPEQDILLEIGKWLSINGEAIYGTRPWKVCGEGPTEVIAGSFADTKRKAFTAQDIRFTTKDQTLYAIALGWPQNGRFTIKSLAAGSKLTSQEVAKVELLGYTPALKWNRDAAGLAIEVPMRKLGEHAFAFRISPVDRAPTLNESLTLGKRATASDVWQNRQDVHGADKAVDGRPDTRWASASRKTAWLEVDLGKPERFTQAYIDEWEKGGKRIKSFELQYKDGDAWKTFYKGTTIGPGFFAAFDPVTAQVVRLNILEAVEPTINEFHLFAPRGQ